MRATLILLPATVYGLLTLLFAKRGGAQDIAEACVKGHLALFAFIAVSTEILSTFSAISFVPILMVWLLGLLGCSIAATLVLPARKHGFPLPVLQSVSPQATMLLGVIVFILASTCAVAILYPPNNWDSMTYHMSRVAHWISNSSVSFYPTSNDRQNYMMPLAEFAIMHLQILSGDDSFANLVQWTSFFVLIWLGPLMAAELGLSKRHQLISATITATLPMAILQASSTQNDLVVSSFVMSFGLFMLRIRKHLNAENVLFAATSLGLALLTKGTAFLYCAALGLALAAPTLLEARTNRLHWLKTTGALAFMVIVALVLNMGHFWRNYQLYQSPLSTEGTPYRNEDLSPAAFVSNILRNGALHLTPSLWSRTPTLSKHSNGYIYRVLQRVLGGQLNNSKTTWAGTSFSLPYRRHEDTAGNLIHMLIVLFSMLSVPLLWRSRRQARPMWYALGIMLGAMLYCWYLKWQPWASRLHTPLFVMAAPLLAMAIVSKTGNTRKYIGYVALTCMVFYSLPFTLRNETRPLLSRAWSQQERMQLYFLNRRQLFNGYKKAIEIMVEAKAQQVGLYLGNDDWEYPFWVFAQRMEKSGSGITFRHVKISHNSRTLEQELPLPLYVIATEKTENWEYESLYTPVYTSNYLRVLRKSERELNMDLWP